MGSRILFRGIADKPWGEARLRAAMEQFHPIEQELCLSLLGPEVWHTYRQGHIPATLLLDLHIGGDNFDRFMAGAQTVINRLPHTARYSDIDTLSSVITAGQQKLPDRVFRVTADSYYNGIPVADLAAAYGIETADPRAQRVGRLATFVLDCMDPTHSHYDAVSMGSWLRVWLDLCDAALTIDAVPTT